MTEATDLTAWVVTAIRLANGRLEPLRNSTTTSKHGSSPSIAFINTLDGLIKSLNTFEKHLSAHAGDVARLNCLQKLSPVVGWCIDMLITIDTSDPSCPPTDSTNRLDSERALKDSSEILESAGKLFESAVRADFQ